MKVSFPVNQRTIRLKIPNALIFNRFSFLLIKLIFGFKFHSLFKIKYKHVNPLIKKSKEFKGYELVNVRTIQGEMVIVSL